MSNLNIESSIRHGLSSAALIMLLAAESLLGAVNDGGPTQKSFSVDEMAGPLDMLASHVEANYGMLRTWIATYTFADTFYFPGLAPGLADDPGGADRGFWERTRGVIEFQWDRSADQLHVHYKPTTPVEYVEVGTQRRTQNADIGDVYHWIITPEHWIEFGENVHLGQLKDYASVPSVPPTGGRIAKRKARRLADKFTRVIHPQAFISHGSNRFSEECRRYVDGLRGKLAQQARRYIAEHVALVQTSHNGNTAFELTIRYPSRRREPNSIITVQTTFDSSAGFQPTSWVQSVGKEVSEKRTIA